MDTGSSSGDVHDDIGEGFPAGGAKPHCEAGGGGGGGGYKMIRQNKTIIIGYFNGNKQFIPVQ